MKYCTEIGDLSVMEIAVVDALAFAGLVMPGPPTPTYVPLIIQVATPLRLHIDWMSSRVSVPRGRL